MRLFQVKRYLTVDSLEFACVAAVSVCAFFLVLMEVATEVHQAFFTTDGFVFHEITIQRYNLRVIHLWFPPLSPLSLLYFLTFSWRMPSFMLNLNVPQVFLMVVNFVRAVNKKEM